MLINLPLKSAWETILKIEIHVSGFKILTLRGYAGEPDQNDADIFFFLQKIKLRCPDLDMRTDFFPLLEVIGKKCDASCNFIDGVEGAMLGTTKAMLA